MLYLSRIDLRGLQLDGAKLTGVQIRHANLARALLRETRLDGCDLKDTDLRRANLEHARLTGQTSAAPTCKMRICAHADLSQRGSPRS